MKGGDCVGIVEAARQANIDRGTLLSIKQIADIRLARWLFSANSGQAKRLWHDGRLCIKRP